MPRPPRFIVPNFPHHVVQRGHNGRQIFFNDRYYKQYLDFLRKYKEELECKIYAFCLMTNHVHIIINPGNNILSLSKFMMCVSGMFTRYANHFEDCRGTLWEGRYKVSVIDTDSYLLACSRYVELNPVTANMVSRPEQCFWSSYRSKIGLNPINWLDLDPCYLGIGKNNLERFAAYKQWIKKGISKNERKIIRGAYRKGIPTGPPIFVDEIMKKFNCQLKRNGRPLDV